MASPNLTDIRHPSIDSRQPSYTAIHKREREREACVRHIYGCDRISTHNSRRPIHLQVCSKIGNWAFEKRPRRRSIPCIGAHHASSRWTCWAPARDDVEWVLRPFGRLLPSGPVIDWPLMVRRGACNCRIWASRSSSRSKWRPQKWHRKANSPVCDWRWSFSAAVEL